jgi:sulfite exporter TauE/SafE
MLTSTLFLTVFLGALVSGWHCALMCGGIAAAIEKNVQSNQVITAPLRQGTKKVFFYEQILMHAGRITSYVLLGALAGSLGFPIWQQGFLPVQRVLFALASGIFLLQGYRVLKQSKGQVSIWEAWLNEKTAHIWSHLAKKVIAGHHHRARWWSGIVWGLVPCGLIYSVLPLAFLSGNPLSGAWLMLAFGLGTLPNLLLISGFSARLAGWGHLRWVRYFVAFLMFLTGLFGLYRALTLPEVLLKGGFCIA